jgi:dihydroorotate dehydrogenase
MSLPGGALGLGIDLGTSGVRAALLDQRGEVRAETALAQTLWGRPFPHPVGLAAGFDKDARALAGLAPLSFNFLSAESSARQYEPHAQPRAI